MELGQPGQLIDPLEIPTVQTYMRGVGEQALIGFETTPTSAQALFAVDMALSREGRAIRQTVGDSRAIQAAKADLRQAGMLPDGTL